ncbi:MAG TPA: hypothetical protein VLY23_13325 [Candidatus Acidoferrum sp.]|nr:hypothetical protein [Candidatus Acidoferrum sp.]
MILLGKIVLGMAGTAVAGVGLLCSEGFVQVKVIEKQPQGHHINVIAPALLGPIAAHFVPRRDLANASEKIQPYLPTIRVALGSLREADDVVFVEVTEPDQHVRVSKSGGSIVVDVDDPGETVHVSTPIRAIEGTVEQLAAASPDPH